MKEAMEGLPTWARFIAAVGVPSAIALYLVWVLTAGVASAQQVEAMSKKVDDHTAATERQLERMTTVLETQVRLARVICRSVAKSDLAKADCDR
jgi:hypothetical protein